MSHVLLCSSSAFTGAQLAEERDLCPVRFRGREAEFIIQSGAPHIRVWDDGAGPYVRVLDWVGRIWLKLPGGDEGRVPLMRRFLEDPELRDAALSVLDLTSSPVAALAALLRKPPL